MLVLLLAACSGPPKDADTSSSDTAPVDTASGDSASGDTSESGTDDTAVPTPSLALTGVGVVDPLLGPPSPVTLSEVGGDAVRLTVESADGLAVRTLADGSGWVDGVAWDARDDAGVLLPVGAYTLRGELLAAGVTVATAELPVWRARVGVQTGTFGGERIPLLWPDAGGTWFESTADSPTFQLLTIDHVDSDGALAATPVPPVWADLYVPPDEGRVSNLPVAYPWNATPTLALLVAGDTAGAVVSARIEGWTGDADALAPGDTVTFTKDTPLAEALGVVEGDLTVEWLAGDSIFATQTIPMRAYALYGPPVFPEVGAPFEPWPAVIDPVLRREGPIDPDPAAVRAAVVDEVYFDEGLAYDTVRGATAYVGYTSGFNGAVFDLTGFVHRRRGDIVNCTDCAAIVGTYAGMLGVELDYAIILQNFALNYILAIGGDTFSPCPFGTYGCGFSYHAVTTPDDAATIYDATLQLDGDDDPSTAPNTPLEVLGVPGDEYLDRLVMSGSARYDYIQPGSFR